MDNSHKIGMVVGVFDLFHIGHLKLLQRSKAECDYLKVGVLEDNYVRSYKHKEPIYNQKDRMQILAAIRYVDEVIPISSEETLDKIKLYNHYGFNILFAGDDWKNTKRYNDAEKALSDLGVKIKFLPYTKGISTTLTKQKVIGSNPHHNQVNITPPRPSS